MAQIVNRQKNRYDYLLDMCSSTAEGPRDGKPADDDGNRLFINSDTMTAMLAAVEKARDRGEFDVPMKREVGEQILSDQPRGTIRSYSENRNQKKFVTVEFDVSWQGNDSKTTRITVDFGRDEETCWIRLQGNPTSTQTGQNIAPPEPMFFTKERQNTLSLVWPYFVFLSICSAADPDFREPLSLTKRILKGDVTCQNFQVAFYLPLAQKNKSSFVALVGAGFRAPRVQQRADGNGLEAFDIGARLGITVEPFPTEGEEVSYTWASLLLRKWSGKHEIASVTFYCKATQEKLTPVEVMERGLTDLIRVDITFKRRGIDRLFSAAQEHARKHNVDLELSTNKNGELIANAANLGRCIDALDKLYQVTIGERHHSGFRAWLMADIVHGLFLLRELFEYTPRKWRKVEKWMAEWRKKNDRYKVAFDNWLAIKFEDKSLRNCLIAAGFGGDTATKRIKELKELGFSGNIPPVYWTNRRTIARSWGSTDREEKRYWTHRDAGSFDDARELELLWEERVSKAMRVARRTILRFDKTANLPSAPMVGTIVRSPRTWVNMGEFLDAERTREHYGRRDV